MRALPRGSTPAACALGYGLAGMAMQDYGLGLRVGLKDLPTSGALRLNSLKMGKKMELIL